MAQIRWSPIAIRELQSIHEYIAVDSELYADRMIDRIMERVGMLESHVLMAE